MQGCVASCYDVSVECVVWKTMAVLHCMRDLILLGLVLFAELCRKTQFRDVVLASHRIKSFYWNILKCVARLRSILLRRECRMKDDGRTLHAWSYFTWTISVRRAMQQNAVSRRNSCIATLSSRHFASHIVTLAVLWHKHAVFQRYSCIATLSSCRFASHNVVFFLRAFCDVGFNGIRAVWRPRHVISHRLTSLYVHFPKIFRKRLDNSYYDASVYRTNISLWKVME